MEKFESLAQTKGQPSVQGEPLASPCSSPIKTYQPLFHQLGVFLFIAGGRVMVNDPLANLSSASGFECVLVVQQPVPLHHLERPVDH